MKNKMGPESRKTIHEELIGKWIIISPAPYSGDYSGKVLDIQGNYLLLNPSMQREYFKKSHKAKLVDRLKIVPLINSIIDETTKKNLENSCEYLNSRKNSKKSNN